MFIKIICIFWYISIGIKLLSTGNLLLRPKKSVINTETRNVAIMADNMIPPDQIMTAGVTGGCGGCGA